MLPNSDVVSMRAMNNSANNWKLAYVYKIAPEFPISLTPLGQIEIPEQPTLCYIEGCEAQEKNCRLNISLEIASKRYRNDLQGVSLTCGLVVCLVSIVISIIVTYLQDDVIQKK